MATHERAVKGMSLCRLHLRDAGDEIARVHVQAIMSATTIPSPALDVSAVPKRHGAQPLPWKPL
jgi:hypothetical protein